MKILHFDPYSGISGDMTIGALLDISKMSFPEFSKKLSKLGLHDEYEILLKKTMKNGISAKKFEVIDKNNLQSENHEETHQHEHTHEHAHHHHDEHNHDKEKEEGHSHGRTYNDILKIINDSSLSDSVKIISSNIFDEIAICESVVHDKDIAEIGFHEVGAIDSIVDVVGTAILIDYIGADKVTFSKISVGSGTVKCAHGIVPVPAPATEILLYGMDVCSTEIKSELTTPTGAGILVALGKQVKETSGKIMATGYGAGTKNFSTRANVLKVTLLETEETENKDKIFQIETNIDDERGEVLGYCVNNLMKMGALDAFFVPIYMKKNRPAYMLTVLSKEENKEKIIDEIMSTTSSIGVRYFEVQRKILSRESFSFEVEDVEIFAKKSQNGRIKIEFESIMKYSEIKNISIPQAEEKIKGIMKGKI